MVESASKEWAAEETRIRAIGADGSCLPIERPLINLITALNLLGFPTYGSCAGHAWPGEPEEIRYPFVASRFAPPRCLRGERGKVLWRNPRSGSSWERRYLALLTWHRYRPLAEQLRGLYHAFADGRAQLFDVQASWRGVLLIPRDLHELWDGEDPVAISGLIFELQQELEAFGAFLRDEILAKRLSTTVCAAS